MVLPREPQTRATPEARPRLSRRQLLTQGAAASAAGVLLAGRSAAQGPAEPLSEQNLLDASALSGERLSRQRLQAMKPRLESTLKQLEVLRQFDADETEPLPMVQL